MSKKRGAAKVPYEGYTLPPSSERGGEFIDFNKVKTTVKMPIKKIIKRKRNGAKKKVS
tara:strand:- start:2324 stop:2497 length:174 start_codon:yes stop_codon:yes gene_type:complete